AGLLADCFLQTPFGVSALAYSLVAYGVGSVQATILHASWWIPPLTVVLASAAGVALYAGIGAVVGESHLVSARLATVAPVVAVLNAALAPLAIPVVRWAAADPLGSAGLVLR